MQVNVIPLPPTPLQITNHPTDLTVEEGHSATLTAGVSGSGAHYQWFKDGVAIPGATTLALIINSITAGDAGRYALQASNVFGVVYSGFALLSVLVDRSPPVLLAADILDGTHILASFSEPLLVSAGSNAANYSVTNTFGAVAAVTSAALTNGTNVLLTVAPLADWANYIVTAQAADVSPHQNAIVSAIAAARSIRFVAFDSSWFYYDPYPPFDNADPGPNWKDESYDTSTWGFGPSAFAYSVDGSLAPPVPVRTTLGPTPSSTAYFRAAFPSPVGANALTLKLRHAVDDGAVFYVNGSEVHRFNMPEGAPSPQTAAAMLTNPMLSTETEVSATAVHSGENIVTAELHQIRTDDTDKFFAMELIGRAETLPIGPLLIFSGPVDTTVNERARAAFHVNQAGAESIQWEINGATVPGATNSSFVVSNVSFSLDGASVRVICANQSGSLMSTSATLRVIADATPPVLLSALATAGTFTLSFSKLLSAATATNVANYLVTNTAGATLAVAQAALTNGTNVVLTFTTVPAGNYIVAVSGVTDTSALANAIAPGSAVIVGADYFIPMDSAWKYLLINTNETVQSTFMEVNYDDSSWLGPSNALLYVEGATLPGPKNTLLSLFADPAQTQRINTYYFRQKFVTPVIASNVTIQIRHIIDDGMVLHLNGKEIYRSALMAAGVVTAATQATAAIGDATLLGPFDVTVTNLVGGTNILAAEVHQSGSASADVVMGVEASVHVAGATLPPLIQTNPSRLALIPWGDQFALNWDESGFTLETAENVVGPWTPLGGSSPFFVPRTNAAAFFRLRK
jgi:hypothetical protein